jgi:predicted HTH transcriptional regulator
MDDRELERLLEDLESDRVERKASILDGKKIRQTMCAFANDLPDHKQPGVLVIGVKQLAKNIASKTGLSLPDFYGLPVPEKPGN